MEKWRQKLLMFFPPSSFQDSWLQPPLIKIFLAPSNSKTLHHHLPIAENVHGPDLAFWPNPPKSSSPLCSWHPMYLGDGTGSSHLWECITVWWSYQGCASLQVLVIMKPVIRETDTNRLKCIKRRSLSATFSQTKGTPKKAVGRATHSLSSG